MWGGGGGGGGGSLDWNSENVGGFSGVDFQKGITGLQIEPKL